MIRILTLLPPLALLGSLAAQETVYEHTVSPAKPTAESDYLAIAAEQRARLRTTPDGASFVAESGRVIEAETKRHQGGIWIETKDTETEHEARSPAIAAYRGSYVACVGRFKVQGGGGSGSGGEVPEWKSKLKERCGHIIIAWQYPGDAGNPHFVGSGVALRNQYIAAGDPVVLVTIGSGGQLARLEQLTAHLRAEELTPGKSVSVDSIGHGGPYVVDTDRHSSLGVVDGTTIKDVLPQSARDQLEDASGTISDASYVAPFIPELGCPSPKISLWHCFTADPGTVDGAPSPSIAQRVKALVAKATVLGVKGLCFNPGPAPVPPGATVEF